MIRDKVGKASASLDQFLRHVCPEIGIIRVSDYLKTMGWKFMPSMAQSPCNTYRHQKKKFGKTKERQEGMCRCYHLEVKHGGEEGAGAIT
jgi:hypothetical protein